MFACECKYYRCNSRYGGRECTVRRRGSEVFDADGHRDIQAKGLSRHEVGIPTSMVSFGVKDRLLHHPTFQTNPCFSKSEIKWEKRGSAVNSSNRRN